MYKNTEGYNSPTEGEALGRIAREERAARKAERDNRRHSIMQRKKIYVASRYAGNIPVNIENTVCCCQYVISCGGIPVASHLIYPQMLNDNDHDERELGIAMGLALLALCDEVWIFRDSEGLSAGMRTEEQAARKLRKPVRYFRIEEVLGWKSPHRKS